ncbi:VOC family protein [Zestomonas carbonaria]|uniref:VOC domain-containing protein n=1 Tax=Zestomonas carbonaria TaxID=2762745 RepID=A0A7U7EQA9_9GAMM|nr:VOC family protein [Pseudomonas carbonaria]CAD5109141.1 hypothetical protein PSEWESI4_03437 [Pseudomonas carbonaria]
MSTPRNTHAYLIPCLHYRDAPAAIAWLRETFGFHEHLVVPDEQGGILHAELSCGNGMLMLGSVREEPNPYRQRMRLPQQAGGNTQSLYMVVDAVDELYARAKAAGAEMIIDIKDEDYGGRGFTCLDPEGHVWSFGSYDPWQTDDEAD